MGLDPCTKLGHFEITGRLGAGGMGEVYRARDTNLGRDVAIKVLPEDFASDEDRMERFEREAKMLAALSHAHIGALHDFREDNNIRYLVLELVEGESLQDRIDRGPIPVREALVLFIQIAEALEAAHAKSIIHRDLKPGNVQLSSDGVVKVLDFGLARPVEAATTPPRTRTPTEPTLPHDPNKITTYGSIIGTPSYMSPEQVRGTEIDQRSDIWAFGCCLFEALSGIRPFSGETRTDVLASIVHEEPDWSRLPEDLPREVRALLRRCLEKVPKRRLSAAGDIAAILQELADDLKHAARESGKSKAVAAPSRSRSWLTVLVGVLVVAVGVVGAAISFLQNQSFRMDFGAERDARSASTLPRPKIERIAVLPFLNQGDPSQEAFTDGMRDALNTELAKVSSIKLIGRMAAERYKDTELSPKEIAEALGGIDAFVNATVLRDEEDNVRITVDLMDPETQETLWTQPYERPLENIFQLHSEVALQIVQEIEAVITPKETERIRSVQADVVPAAYDAYLRGEELWAPDEDSMNAALKEYQRAVDSDPSFVKGWAALGDTHWEYTAWGLVHSPEHTKQARDAYDRALKLEPELPDVLSQLAEMRWRLDGEFADAEKLYRQAMGLAADDANVLVNYAYYLATVGRWKEARAYIQTALALEPDDPDILTWAGSRSFLSGDYPASLKILLHAHEIAPEDMAIRVQLAVAYKCNGRYDDAVALAEETARLGKNDIIYAVLYGTTLFSAGKPNEGRAVLQDALKGFTEDDERGLAWRFLGQLTLGNTDQALAHAKRAIDVHDPLITEALRAWVYLPWRIQSITNVTQVPRYWDLIEQVGYPPLPPEHPGYAEEQEWLVRRKAEQLVKEQQVVASDKMERIAVLPFENQGDSSQEAFTDGMRDALNTELAKVSSIKLIGRMAAERYKGTKLAPKEIAEELGGIDAFVNATVLRDEEDNVRITVDLMDPETQETLWTQPYERPLQNIFQLHSDVALEIVKEIKALISPEETERIKSVQTNVVPEAYDAYLQGKALIAPHKSALAAALAALNQAVEIDPRFARAWSMIGRVHAMHLWWGITSVEQHLDFARAAFKTALELDPNDGLALAELATMKWTIERDFSEAETLLRSAVARAPHSIAAHYRYGIYLAVMGRWQEAEQRAETILDLDPDSSDSLRWAGGEILFRTDNLTRAIEVLEKSRRLYPDDFEVLVFLSGAYALAGRHDEALRMAADAYERGNRESAYGMNYAFRLLEDGDVDGSQRVFDAYVRGAQNDGVDTSPWEALYAVARGDIGQAVALYATAIDSTNTHLCNTLRMWPYNAEGLAPASAELRRDPRYWDLIEKVGFPPLPPEHPGYAEEQDWLVRRKAEKLLKEQKLAKPGSIERIAVLPFENQGDPSQEAFTDGMRDALNTELAKVSSIKLIGRMAAERYKDTKLAPKEIAVELGGINAFVNATVLRDEEDNVRITVDLMDPQTDETLWSEKYERPLQNIFQLHSEVALQIVKEIRAVITPEETERIKAVQANVVPAAYDAYLRGISAWEPDEASTIAALAEFGTAVQLDPNFADAWYCIGSAHWKLVAWGIAAPRDHLPKAREAFQRALALSPNAPQVLSALAEIEWKIGRDYITAEKRFRDVIALDSSNANVSFSYAQYLATMGRRTEAIKAAETAITLEPDNTEILQYAGSVISMAGDSKRALDILERAYVLKPNSLSLGIILSRVYIEMGVFAKAVDVASNTDRLGGGQVAYRIAYGCRIAEAGQLVKGKQILEEALTALEDDSSVPVWRAWASAYLDRPGEQMRWFERAYELGDPLLPEALRVFPYVMEKHSPQFAAVRKDPRYWALIEKLKLPPLPPDHPGYAEEQEWLVRRKAEQLLKEQKLAKPGSIERIAVLPFENQGDPSQEAFTDGMRDALNTELAKVSSLKLIGRMAAQRYKDSGLSPKEIAEELNGIDAFINATVLRDEQDNVRITVELMDPYTQETLWTKPYERPLENIFQLHSEVALEIVDEIRAVVTPEEAERIKSARASVSPAAYDAYLRGRALFTNPNEVSMKAAIAEFEAAVDMDPNFSDAWYYLGWVLQNGLGWDVLSGEEYWRKAKAAFEQALKIQKDHPKALTGLARIHALYDFDFAQGEKLFLQALQLAPEDPVVLLGYANFLALTGRWNGATEYARAVVDKEPDDPVFLGGSGIALWYAGSFSDSVRALERSHELDPANMAYRYWLSAAYEYNGNIEKAVALAKENTSVDSEGFRSHVLQGRRLAGAGKLDEARTILREALDDPDADDNASWRAFAYLMLGEMDRTFDSLESAIYEREGIVLSLLRVWPYLGEPQPFYDALLQDRRHWDIIERVGFPPLPPEHPGYAVEQEWKVKRAAQKMLDGQPKPVRRLALNLRPQALGMGATDGAISFSPDGTKLIYTGWRGPSSVLYVRDLDGPLESRRLEGTQGVWHRFISPSGSQVGYWSELDGKLHTVSMQGGLPQAIDVEAIDEWGACWIGDSIVFVPSRLGGLRRVAASGGEAQVLATPDAEKGELMYTWPHPLPDGSGVLFTIVTESSNNVALYTFADRSYRILIKDATYAQYVPTGHIVFVRNGTLYAVPFNLDTGQPVGPEAMVLRDLLVSGAPTAAAYTFANDGTLAYIKSDAPSLNQSTVAWVDPQGALEPINLPRSTYWGAALSPNKMQLAVTQEVGTAAIWIYELESGRFLRLTYDNYSVDPVWTQDGASIVFRSRRQGDNDIYRMRADGSEEAVRLYDADVMTYPTSINPSDGAIVINQLRPDTRRDCMLLAEGGTVRPQIATAANEMDARFSPDSGHLAYVSDASGRFQVYVAPYPGPGPARQVSVAGGSQPRWTPDGQALVFQSFDENEILIARVLKTNPIAFDTPVSYFEGSNLDLTRFQLEDVGPDGRLLMTRWETQYTEVVLVQNWFEELKRLAPLKGGG